MKKIFFCLIAILSLSHCSTKPAKEQSSQLLKFFKEKNYFKLDNLMSEMKFEKNNPGLLLYEATIDNVFNRPEESDRLINTLFEKYRGYFNDTITKDLYDMRFSNAYRLQDYKRACLSDSIIVTDYSHVCDSSEINTRKDDISLFGNIINVPKMQVTMPSDSKIPLKRDIAGLLNVPVRLLNDSVDFVFDTGANISVLIESVAKKYGVRLLAGMARTGTSTSKKVEGHMGLLDLRLGNVEIKDAVFLVLPDSDLTYANGVYIIKGVIGFPIMYALKEFVMTGDKFMTVIQKQENTKERNIAFDGQNILIRVIAQNDTLPFIFDSGNTTTNLGALFFTAYKQEILKKCKKEKVTTAGAGGSEETMAYILDSLVFFAGNTDYTLKSLRIYSDDLSGYERKYLYGNFGQDYINKFSEMKINFASMNIQFSGRIN
ncbi:MAG: retropepsin-like aspartic protease [Bacteroidales bacterium]|jgi:predicted aspartyl protease